MDRSELAAQKSIRETQGRLGERWSTKKKGKGRRFAGGGLEDRYLRRRGRQQRWRPPEVTVCPAPVDARQRKPWRGRHRRFLFFGREPVRGEWGELRCRAMRGGRSSNCGRAPAHWPNISRHWREVSGCQCGSRPNT
jgi:hypothetical protein